MNFGKSSKGVWGGGGIINPKIYIADFWEGSKAVWNFSEILSVLELLGFPYCEITTNEFCGYFYSTFNHSSSLTNANKCVFSSSQDS